MTFVRGFETAEYESRVQNAQALMHAAKLDAMLLMTEREFTYFAGFQSNFWQSPTRPWFLIIPAQGAPIAVIPSIGENALSLTWIKDARIWASPCPQDEGVSLVADTLRGLPQRFGQIGVPMGPETHIRMPANDFADLRAALDPVPLVDATDIVRSLRMVKSEAELAKHRYICDLVSGAYQDIGTRVTAGMTERDVLAAHRLDVLGRGADTVPYVVSTAGAGGSDDAIRFPTDRALTAGDVLFIDTG
ncbi:MAG: aminopeptidase P family N-terminal domain-containing protein, partial [Pseudomonadota bacterium]